MNETNPRLSSIARTSPANPPCEPHHSHPDGIISKEIFAANTIHQESLQLGLRDRDALGWIGQSLNSDEFQSRGKL